METKKVYVVMCLTQGNMCDTCDLEEIHSTKELADDAIKRIESEAKEIGYGCIWHKKSHDSNELNVIIPIKGNSYTYVNKKYYIDIMPIDHQLPVGSNRFKED